MAGKWKIKLDEKKDGLGLFTQKGSRVQGSILTNTGDYRFFDGFIKNNKVKLYGFDGVFSFILDIIVVEEQFEATMFAGKSYNTKISASRDDNFQLADPNSMTKLNSKN